VANFASRQFHFHGWKAVTPRSPSVIPNEVEESLIIRHGRTQNEYSKIFHFA